MARQPTWGDGNKERAKRFLENLLSRRDNNENELKDVKCYCHWKDEEGNRPRLVVKSEKRFLQQLTEPNLTESQVGEVKNNLKELKILNDDREKTQGKTEWLFTLTLWSKDTETNLSRFDKEWEKKRSEKSKAHGDEPITPEFEALVNEKTRRFVGRGFVFKAFETFLVRYHNGYFTVVGHPGTGKSAIAAKYANDHKAICYFNILAEGRNRPEEFLKSVRQQLINRYELQNAENANLSTLLTMVSHKLSSSQRLVIVVDALDEVKQQPGSNILHLPTTLPHKVYFLLTRRPYHLNTRRLSSEAPFEELYLENYCDFNREDAENCIRLFLNEDPSYSAALSKWIRDRNITPEYFVEQLATKSEYNFMYLKYVLPDIARGSYNNLNFEQLPVGLQNYYQQHWERMRMDDAPNKIIILYILVEAQMPLSDEMIARIAQEERYEVEKVLKEWTGYLTMSKVKEENKYSFYHTSFLDYLEGRRELNKDRRILEKANQLLNIYFERQMM